MLIKNLTSKQQKVVVREIIGTNREYDIFLAPSGSTTIELMVVKNPDKYAGIIEIDGAVVEETTKEIIPQVEKVEEPKVEEPKVEESHEEIVEESKEDVEQPKDSFICDVCGAEFASAKGLATHKHRAHE